MITSDSVNRVRGIQAGVFSNPHVRVTRRRTECHRYRVLARTGCDDVFGVVERLT